MPCRGGHLAGSQSRKRMLPARRKGEQAQKALPTPQSASDEMSNGARLPLQSNPVPKWAIPAQWMNTHQLCADVRGVRSGSEARLPTSGNQSTSCAKYTDGV